MKSRNLTSLIALGLFAPLAAWSESSTTNGQNRSQSTNHQAEHQSASSTDIHRISEDRLNTQLTASSLIGKKVVDQNGKDVGTVKDISLTSVLPQQLRQPGNRPQSGAAEVGREVGQMADRATGNVTVYISVGGFIGIGNDLVGVSANQLRRDGDNLRIDMSQDQIKSIASKESSRYSSSD